MSTIFETTKQQLSAPDICPNCLANLNGGGRIVNLSNSFTKTNKSKTNTRYGEVTTKTTQESTTVLNVRYCDKCYSELTYEEEKESIPGTVATFIIIGIVLLIIAFGIAAFGEIKGGKQAFFLIEFFFLLLAIAVGWIKHIPELIGAIVIGFVISMVVSYFVNQSVDPVAKAARDKAKAAISLEQSSLSKATITIREDVYSRAFQITNNL